MRKSYKRLDSGEYTRDICHMQPNQGEQYQHPLSLSADLMTEE